MMNPHYYSLSICGLLPTSIVTSESKSVIADWQDAHGLVADGAIGPATADAMHLDALARGVVLPFSDAEFLQGAPLPAGWGDRLRRTIRMACVVRRDVFGGVPTEVLSGGGFRLESGGNGQATKSQHLYLRAADLRPAKDGTGTPIADWYAKIDAMQADGRLEVGGCKVYRDQARPFAHVDWRGNRARW